MSRTLFDPDPPALPVAAVPATANADPDTSAAAEAEHTASGRREAHARVALGLVRLWPGETGHELWSHATAAEKTALKGYHELYRRLADLKGIGLVKHGPKRKCRVKGTAMVTWWPVNRPD